VGRYWQIPEEAQNPAAGSPLSLEGLLIRIEQNRVLLASHRPLTSGELLRLHEEFAVEYTYNSNAIEGNTLTLRETALVLRGITVARKPLKDHLEVVGHKEAFDFVCGLVAEQPPLTESVIKQIHSLVLADRREDRGVYRRIPVRIAGAQHEPVQPFLVGPKMVELLTWYNADRGNIITRLARLHMEFERIHPYIDGNGRTGRLLVNLELMKACYLPIDVKFVDRARYYGAFDAYEAQGSLLPMECHFEEYEDERLAYYLRIVEAV
jgi:fic family protein